jgi:excinuclease ABC subunit C
MTATAESRPERIEAQLKGIPAKPGVYLFRGAKDTVLYVGKAKSLRSRVRSYFRGGDSRPGLENLTERVERIEVIVTSNETEAFHLEQNLIRRHRPPFNVRLRDDKSYPYIAVTVEDDYPRVMFTRERHRRGVVYFGPYANAKKVRETLDVLNRVFAYRPCEGPQPGRHSGIPCLDYHIERCLAPCVGYVSKEDYGEIIERVIEFLSGESRPIQRELEGKMRAAAEQQDFEAAARYRNRLYSVRHLAERQAADKRAIGTVDVIGIAVGDGAAVQVFPLRGGRLTDRHSFFLENVAGQDLDSLLEAFALEYYGSAPSIPPQIIVPPAARPSGALSEFLSEKRGSRVEVRPAQRGEKRRLQELAQQNAELALEHDTAQTERTRLRRIEALEELRESLNLESLPLRIECFDISNIQDQAPVGSMVVFQDALPKKAHYRKFGIRKEGGQDDFAMMAEVVSRRFARAQPATTTGEYDDGFASIPNLVVIDGGKGQLSAALAAMQAYDLPRVAVISLAKREEEVFVPGRPDPIVLDSASPGLQLLQRIRDEAHRFALGFHRQRRESRAHESILDALPGVGPARRRALIRYFGSPERILAAGPEEFEGVPGVPAKTGRQIYAALHRAGRA